MTGTDFNQLDQHILSIRLSADGFSFSTCHSDVTGTPRAVFFPVNTSCSMTANLKALFSSTEILKVPFQQVSVLIDTPRYTTMPFDLYEDEHLETLFYHNFSKNDNEMVLCNILGKTNTVVLFGMDKHTHQLLNEQFPEARIYAAISPLMEHFAQDNRKHNDRDLYVHLRKSAMDVFAYERGKLLFVNSYGCKQLTDITYYLLYVWQQLGFNPENDQLTITGENKGREELPHELSKFLRNVKTEFNTSDNIPFDMQTLLICE